MVLFTTVVGKINVTRNNVLEFDVPELVKRLQVVVGRELDRQLPLRVRRLPDDVDFGDALLARVVIWRGLLMRES